MSLRYTSFLLACFLALATGCSSDVLTVERDFTAQTITYGVPPAAADAATDVVRSVQDFGLINQLNSYGIAEDEVESVTVAAVRAQLIDPRDSLTFAEVSRGELWLVSAGLEPVLIAEKPAGADGVTADFLLTEPDLEGYLISGSVDAIFRVETTVPPGPDVEVAFDITYRIVGGV